MPNSPWYVIDLDGGRLNPDPLHTQEQAARFAAFLLRINPFQTVQIIKGADNE